MGQILLLLGFVLGLVLAASPPLAYANAVPSTAGITPAEPRDGIILTGSEDPLVRHEEAPARSAPFPSPTRAFLAALDARFLVLTSAKPRRSVSEIKPKSPAGDAQRPSSSGRNPSNRPPRVARADAPVEIVDGPRQGQTGYVHFFLLGTPEGEAEIQVGIELLDGRIAWSFPEVGVSTMPFIRAGTIEVGGRAYTVEHLYGLRPFPDAESMAALRMGLWDRVSPLVEGRIPYCNPFLRSQTICLSCLGLVLEALFPGRMPGSPAMPADFPRTRSRLYYTTDDLLLYLTGFHEIATAEARAARIEQLAIPQYLRDELWLLVDAVDLKDAAGTTDFSKLKNRDGKPFPAGRSYTRTPPQRKRL